jgi:hypothetical protein
MSSDTYTDDRAVTVAKRLSYVVEAFEDEIHHDPERARGNCANESFRFTLALHEVGIDSSMVSGFEVVPIDGRPTIMNGHTAVVVGGTVYDWTARQFWPHDQPVPLIQPLHEWRRTWRNLV